VDESVARVVVPSGEGEEVFLAGFDAGTGLLSSVEAMRYKGASGDKTWAVFRTEDVVYNVDVEALIRSRGL
jgi:hypothetical protein